jgi:hypothetical protein
MASSTSFDAFSLSLSPAGQQQQQQQQQPAEQQPAPNWEQKHEALRAARALCADAKDALLHETLAGLRELAAGLDKDRWMYER